MGFYKKFVWSFFLLSLPMIVIAWAQQAEAPGPAAEAALKRLETLNIPFNIDSFYEAVERNETDQVQLFLQAGMNPNTVEPRVEESALSIAAQMGNVEVVKLLIEKGADVNSRNSRGETPLLAM